MTTRSTLMRAALIPLALAITLSGCGSSKPAARRSATIAITMFAFHPAKLAVAAGTTITFINHDQTAHTATAAAGGFDTGAVAPGRSKTITLRTPGTYTYYCQFHPFMRARITVTK